MAEGDCTRLRTQLLVVRALDPRMLEVALLLAHRSTLLVLGHVDLPHDARVVRLTGPAQVGHRLADHHKRQQLTPQPAECGVAHVALISHCCRLVGAPHGRLRLTAGQHLDIVSLEARDAPRKDDALLLSEVDNEARDALDVEKAQCCLAAAT